MAPYNYEPKQGSDLAEAIERYEASWEPIQAATKERDRYESMLKQDNAAVHGMSAVSWLDSDAVFAVLIAECRKPKLERIVEDINNQIRGYDRHRWELQQDVTAIRSRVSEICTRLEKRDCSINEERELQRELRWKLGYVPEAFDTTREDERPVRIW